MLTAEPSAQAGTPAANRRLAAAEQIRADVAGSLRRMGAGAYGPGVRCEAPIASGRSEMRPPSRCCCVTCT